MKNIAIPSQKSFQTVKSFLSEESQEEAVQLEKIEFKDQAPDLHMERLYTFGMSTVGEKLILKHEK